VLTNGHPLLSAGVITRDFLEDTECAEMARRVVRLRDRWTKRQDGGFFTLGAASYLDGADSQDTYLAASAQTNSVLLDGFGDLYPALHGFLEYVLDEPVTFDERLALPGFHIFELYGRTIADNDVAKRAHFDLQFLRAVPNRTFEATMSFTLPLQQPSGGASLAVWSLRYEDVVQRNLSGQDFAVQHPCEQVSYQTGRMILHDGFVLHAIGAPGCSAPKGRRITLQGHGIRREGRWTIYW
jgi:hypothetical protein